MDNIAIVTDTTADIPVSLASENNITIIPLYVGYEGKLYKEGKEITNEKVYEKTEKEFNNTKKQIFGPNKK